MKFLHRKTTSKGLLSESDQMRVSNAIARAETTTSGEIRVFIENHCTQLTPVDRAAEVFFKLEMDQTRLRNGVIIYIALKDRVAALFGDEGIYEKTGGAGYWQEEFDILTGHLRKGELVEGLEHVIADIGYSLSTHFPYREGIDKNELPDDIVFGDDL